MKFFTEIEFFKTDSLNSMKNIWEKTQFFSQRGINVEKQVYLLIVGSCLLIFPEVHNVGTAGILCYFLCK